MNTTHTLTTYQQRGTLIYQNNDFTFTQVQGWFYLDNRTVVMRKLRGRNRFQLCSAELVHDFQPHQ